MHNYIKIETHYDASLLVVLLTCCLGVLLLFHNFYHCFVNADEVHASIKI